MDELPNDLLISIASRLPVKEAGRTSVVARRWQNIWNFSRVLNFDGSEKLESNNSLEFERERFVEWVKRVVSLYCGENIDEFSAGFNLDSHHGNEIDRWIEFAVRKRVKKLELNFQSVVTDGSWNNATYQDRKGAYKFPDVTKYLNNLPFSLSLVSLSLTKMELPQEILDSFMSNCPTLEHLHLQIVNGFTVFPPSFLATRLSRLALIHCSGLKKIETDPNSVSSLIHLTLGAQPSYKLLRHLDELSGCLSRLETLTLHVAVADTPCLFFVPAFELLVPLDKTSHDLSHFSRAADEQQRLRSSTECQSLPGLKKLVLQMEALGEGGALALAPLMMNAAPLLHEMVLKLIPVGYVEPGQRRHPRYPPMGRKHHSLKVLEIEGGDGIAAGVEVALYVLENAAALDKVVIDGLPTTTAQDLHFLKKNLLHRVFT